MDRNILYGAALLHRLGELLKRGLCWMKEDEYSSYLAQLAEQLKQQCPYFQQQGELIDLALKPNELGNTAGRIIQLAARLALPGKETGREKNPATPLTSIFSSLFAGLDKSYGYELGPLSFSKVFPSAVVELTPEKYQNLNTQFLDELKRVANETQLLFLLEKYWWGIPASTEGGFSDISLFDDARVTAGIALCLYDQYEAGVLSPHTLELMLENQSVAGSDAQEHFLLINGDISGIQSFIFKIASKGAAKTLKGHSIYLGLLSDVIIRYLLKALALKEANLLYNGGGNFYLLAPRKAAERLLEFRKQIAQQLLKFHGGSIYLALDYLPLSMADLGKFNELWERIKEKVNRLKTRKWAEAGLKEHYHAIFGPFGIGAKERECCLLCGVESSERDLVHDPESDKEYCTFCHSFQRLTNEVKNAKYLIVKEVPEGGSSYGREYQDVFRSFGFEYTFGTFQHLGRITKTRSYLLNDFDFLTDDYDGYRLGAFALPSSADAERVMMFKEIAEQSQGDPKLAYLKLDVDNLGNLFCNGLGERGTITRVTALSRMFSLYFEGYIHYLIVKNGWQNYLYVVFSGGDDTFVIGSWDKVFAFGAEFYQKFREFTCHHPQITFSAAFSVFRYNYPVVVAAQLIESALERGKHYLEGDSKIARKDKAVLFGEVFNWEEFACVQEFKKLLLEIIAATVHRESKQEFGRTFLYKIWKSTLGFRKILQDSSAGRVDNVRFWRLAYYLRDVAPQNADRLIQKYRDIVIYNLLDKSGDSRIKNIMIIPAAVKWAQLETRKVRGDCDDRANRIFK